MGGAETWLVEIVRNTHRKKNNNLQFDFLLAGGKPLIFDEEVAGYGCKLHYLLLNKDNILSFARGFRKILRENQYDAIHDHQDYIAGWHFLFGAGLLPPVRAVHFHNPFFQMRNNYGITAGRRLKLKAGGYLLRRFATHIFGTSGQLLEEYGVTSTSFVQQYVGPLHCAFKISNFRGSHLHHKQGVCEEFGWDPSLPLVLFAGRFDVSMDTEHPQNHKNSAFALEVLHAAEGMNMVMAGKNEHILEAFTKRVEALGLSARVKTPGIRKDMVHLMLAADVLLFPSRAEGMGMVAVEAQAAGLPVLASEAVPSEVVVLNDMVRFCSLDEPYEVWALRLREMASRRMETDSSDDARWATSEFNLDVCCRKLEEIYSNK